MGNHSMEQVLVIRRELFDELGAFHGYEADAARYLPAILDPVNNRFLCRADAETDAPTPVRLDRAGRPWG
jgi:hypothetical protein